MIGGRGGNIMGRKNCLWKKKKRNICMPSSAELLRAPWMISQSVEGIFFFLVFKLCQSVTQCAGAALSGNAPQQQSLGRQLCADHVHCRRRSVVAEEGRPGKPG